jgi:hypothetical protein
MENRRAVIQDWLENEGNRRRRKLWLGRMLDVTELRGWFQFGFCALVGLFGLSVAVCGITYARNAADRLGALRLSEQPVLFPPGPLALRDVEVLGMLTHGPPLAKGPTLLISYGGRTLVCVFAPEEPTEELRGGDLVSFWSPSHSEDEADRVVFTDCQFMERTAR